MSTNLPNQTYAQIAPGVRCHQMTYDGSCIGGEFSQGHQTATQIWDVDKDQLEEFIYLTLGWTRTKSDQLFRVIPAKHPSNFALYASRVSNIQGIASTGQVIGGLYGIDAGWKAYRVTVQFEAPTYQILEDGEVQGATGVEEWKRYVQWKSEPSVEFIQRKRNAFWFAGDVPNLQSDQRQIPGVYGSTIRLVKRRLTAIWVQVPDTALFNGGSSSKLVSPYQDDGMGKVNSTEFMGYTAGTLRFDGYVINSYTQPIPPGFVKVDSTTSLAWNVQMNFTYFEPDTSPTYNYPVDGTGYGHNLVPHPTEVYWYPAYLGDFDGSTGLKSPRRPRYQTYEFRNLFKANG